MYLFIYFLAELAEGAVAYPAPFVCTPMITITIIRTNVPYLHTFFDYTNIGVNCTYIANNLDCALCSNQYVQS